MIRKKQIVFIIALLSSSQAFALAEATVVKIAIGAWAAIGGALAGIRADRQRPTDKKAQEESEIVALGNIVSEKAKDFVDTLKKTLENLNSSDAPEVTFNPEMPEGAPDLSTKPHTQEVVTAMVAAQKESTRTAPVEAQATPTTGTEGSEASENMFKEEEEEEKMFADDADVLNNGKDDQSTTVTA